MKILPYDTFKIESALSAKMLAKMLESKIEPRTLSRTPRQEMAEYKGEVFEEGFEIRRILLYRNSFSPVITGNFVSNGPGTDIQIKMALHTFTAVFMCIWLAVTVYILIFNYSSIPFAVGALIFGILITFGGFWWEAIKQKPRLIEMFKEFEEGK